MKKMILIFLAGLMIFSVYNKSKKNEEVKLPDSAIRFRVLANSNSLRDQKIKEEVRDKMQKELYTLLENAKSSKQARNLITSNMDNFNDTMWPTNLAPSWCAHPQSTGRRGADWYRRCGKSGGFCVTMRRVEKCSCCM